MVLVWTGISYTPPGSIPNGIPRRLFSPNPWSPRAYENWTVIKARTIIIIHVSHSAWVEEDNIFMLENLIGHAKCAGALYPRSLHPSNNDCGPVLF